MARMRAEARRRQLLDVAADVFARSGYNGATTAELARAAGITEPILYRHFQSKQELFATLISEISDAGIASWRASLDSAATAEQRLGKLLTGHPAMHKRGRNKHRVICHAMSHCQDDASVRKSLRQHLRRVQSFVRGELAELESQGVIDARLDRETVSWMVVHMATGYAMIGPLNVTGHHKATDDGRTTATLGMMLRSD